jgi:5-methylcytosine-specific restriction endonuclease McrA
MHYDDFLKTSALKRYAMAINLRARNLNAHGDITPEMLQSLILDSGGCCAWCGVTIAGRDFEIDHILALSRGGSNTVDNLAVTCAPCNRRKSDKHPARFALEIAATHEPLTPLIRHLLAVHGQDAQHQPPLFGDDPADSDESPPRWHYTPPES